MSPRRGRLLPSLSRGVVPLVMALFVLPSALAAQTGTIAGEVVDQATAESVASAEVVVVGTNISTLTNAQGRFILRNVRPGEHQIRVHHIGYRTATETVTVVDGQVATVRVDVRRSAVELDALVVSGQAATSARREIGASVVGIDATALETRAISNVSQMLQSRAPGVTIMSSGGQVGQGSRIILRGATSASMSVEPVIYVDGVRVTSERGGGVSHDATTSGFDDINPMDIERIEVIRGAAAATLYGSEASGGVIQIFTRQGGAGNQVWTARSEFGVLHSSRDHWDIGVYSDWFYDRLVRTGQSHSQHLGVRGTLERFSYNVSGTIRAASGVLQNDNMDHRSFRANMRFTPADNFTLNVNTGYTWRLVQFAENGNNSQNIIMNAMRGGPRGQNHPPEELHTREDFNNSGRFTAGMNVSWTPLTNWTHRLQFGTDIVNWDNRRHWPFGDERYPIGHIYNYRRESLTLNVDYTTSYEFDLSPTIESRTSAGFQGYDRARSSNHARGWRLAGPNVRVVNAATNRGSSEWRAWDKQAGVFGEQQFGFNNILFVTAGLRADGHSTFGSEAGWARYPKVDASWNVSEHAFWPERFGTLRVRAAYGTAGQQPGEFDAARTWQAVAAFDSEPAITTLNVGNPDLSPEVSHEIEFGFDASLFGDRVGVEFTRYDQRTKDMLFAVRNPPSQGTLGTQLMNVGEMHNEGIEVGVNVAVIEGRGFRWDSNVNFSTNRNKVISLGGGAPLQVHWTQWIREGYPVGGFFDNRWVINDQGELEYREDDFIGPAYPTRTFNFGNSFGWGRNLSASFLVDFKGGHYLESATSRWMSDALVQAGEPLYDENDPSTHKYAPGTPVAKWCHSPTDPIITRICEDSWSELRGNHVHSADIWRLREVSVAYRLPREWAGHFRASSMMLSVAARNLLRSQNYLGLEAEAAYHSRTHSMQTYFDTPIPREFVAQINVSF
jgi:TonB-dependent starch-binding outer membrane protein SusC